MPMRGAYDPRIGLGDLHIVPRLVFIYSLTRRWNFVASYDKPGVLPRTLFNTRNDTYTTCKVSWGKKNEIFINIHFRQFYRLSEKNSSIFLVLKSVILRANSLFEESISVHGHLGNGRYCRLNWIINR